MCATGLAARRQPSCIAVYVCGPTVKQWQRAWQEAGRRGQARLIRPMTALLEVGTGRPGAQAAALVGVSESTVYRWLHSVLRRREVEVR